MFQESLVDLFFVNGYLHANLGGSAIIVGGDVRIYSIAC